MKHVIFGAAAGALGGFAWGFLIGKKAYRPTFRHVKALEKKEAGALTEQQDAFERMMGYDAETAYGLKGADEL